MFLISAKIKSFKSINTPQTVFIDDEVTVLVGMNEAGKTVFLKALEKSNDAQGLAKFDPVHDYPKKGYTDYLKQHAKNPAKATVLTYRLTGDEVSDLNAELHTEIPAEFTFSITHLYDNTSQVSINVDEQPVLKALLAESALSTDAKTALKKAQSFRSIPESFVDISPTEEDKQFLEKIKSRITKATRDSVVEYEVWEWLESRTPQFLYFSDYNILPSKINLTDLAARVRQAVNDPEQLTSQHRSALALLRKAGISIDDFSELNDYETQNAILGSVSMNLTENILEFWKQNENIWVKVDIKSNSGDVAPYNNGSNIYLRTMDRRHLGVETPFDQRSRGFIWFFSFLVWFDSVKEQIGSKREIILLLDEPGLALHALAQADFLHYIDDLAQKHQVIYTTHSPFMVHSRRLHQVRMVEDKPKVGTIISDNLSGSDPRTIFPLQAALGWTIAQNLFISPCNLLVEGASDLIYLKTISSLLEKAGKIGLREDITIVPVGGLDNVVTFLALLSANDLKIAVLHDYKGSPEQKLEDMVKAKIVHPKFVLNASQFRNLDQLGKEGQASDTEDLFETVFYLDYFNRTFSKQLSDVAIKESELPKRDRIIQRLESYLKDKKIELRPSGGFNHYAVASYFASNPPDSLDENTLKRFEELFKKVNAVI
ncbi:MAG: AAA family ATPase [Methylovulum sp.]|uniref:AAA family ATPase n=1 Tax=Methylovulum sp. TaxID=1916980 RepID=UPI00262A7141|nr:AAA family ATPase [Methylovulum sp.]MDD2722565.1 AAA family ATPase [Methylovulum sp.]MDD5123093.1 AAA family ATPase [Methylovulum sp.]